MRTRLLIATLLLAAPVSHAQTGATTDTPPVTTVKAAPASVKEVVARGTAAIGAGGLVAARRAATALALRSAVERATGVFVSAHTLTHNYTLIHDQVSTRAEGFATLKEIVSETDSPETVTVTVRALVSLRPLAERLKGLGLTRAWRIYVRPGEMRIEGGGDADAALADLESRLTTAGFPVVSSERDADLILTALPQAESANQLPLDTAAGPMTLYTVRGQILVRAIRVGTGEVVTALSASDNVSHIDRAEAASRALKDSTEAIAPLLIDALMVLPARESQPVQLAVSRLRRMKDVGRLEDALADIPGVRQVTRRSFDGAAGRAVWELDVLADALPLLSRHLEEDAVLRAFHLTVASDAGAKIVARVGAL